VLISAILGVFSGNTVGTASDLSSYYFESKGLFVNFRLTYISRAFIFHLLFF